jgi:hypothetical protein
MLPRTSEPRPPGRRCLTVLVASVVAVSATAAPTHYVPRFEDFPLTENWNRPSVPLKLITRSERMFRTQLTNAAKEPPNFAGHYRLTFWGCRSQCGAGAVIGLQTGLVFPPPLDAHEDGWDRWIKSPALFEGSAIDFRRDSKLVVLKGGINYSEVLKANVPDVYYFVWEHSRFRQLLFISCKQPSNVEP